MANAAHVALLKRSVSEWNAWRKDNKEIVPDLKGADLWGSDLSGAYLSWLDLTATRAACADLTGAYLTGSKLVRTDLRDAILVGAHLSASQFLRASVENADFTRALMGWTVFAWVDLSKARGLDAVFHDAPSAIDLDTLAQSRASISSAFLRRAGVAEPLIAYAGSLAADPSQFYSCFISYSHADREFARRLYESLQQRGIRCWLDEKLLLPGDDIHEEVDREWDRFLLCCSEHSLKPGSWVDKEIAIVLEKEYELTRQREERVRALIPLNLDGYLFSEKYRSGYRAEIRRRLAADFTGWNTDVTTFDVQLENVVRALRSDKGTQ